ncbi:MAG: AAA family ATPase, partial [Deltaproteobacteria bacterium]|nr:AAA family ATPase [Deltaproteobacteria bacterium]
MTVPTVTDCVGGYVYEWEQEQVHVEVSRLRSDSKGAVHGEVIIRTSAPGYAPHLHQAQFNFSSTTSRKGLAKSLSEAYKANWVEILEQVCVNTLERFRKGEPVIDLWTSDNVSPPEYLLEPLIIRNYPTIIFGDPSTAKSTISLILTQIVQLPWTDNPLGLRCPDRPVRCLYLDWETDYETIQWQMTTLQRGMGLPPLMLNYRNCALPLSQDVDQIRRHILDTGSELIIVDSLGLAAGGELKETTPALTFYAALRQLKTTALILA